MYILYHCTNTHTHRDKYIYIYNFKNDKVYICNIRNSLTKGFQHHPHPTTSKHGICICSAPPSGRLCSGWVASVGSWGKVPRIATVSSVPIWKEWGKLEMKWESFLALYLKSTCKLEINFVICFIIVTAFNSIFESPAKATKVLPLSTISPTSSSASPVPTPGGRPAEPWKRTWHGILNVSYTWSIFGTRVKIRQWKDCGILMNFECA